MPLLMRVCNFAASVIGHIKFDAPVSSSRPSDPEETEGTMASSQPAQALSHPDQNQKAIMDACISGDVSKLQRLLDGCDVKKGEAAVDPTYGEPDPTSGPPPTSKMITAAVAHRQSSIVALLLATYPNVNIKQEKILEAAFANADLQTFKLLHSHSPSLVNFEFQRHTTALMEACRGSNPLLPDYLLDNGVDPNEGGFPGGGPLFYAVILRQPLEIVTKMVQHGAIVTAAVVHEAIRRRDPDVLRFLLSHGDPDSSRHALELAHEWMDWEIISVIKEHLKDAKQEPVSCKEKGMSVDKQWYQFWN